MFLALFLHKIGGFDFSVQIEATTYIGENCSVLFWLTGKPQETLELTIRTSYNTGNEGMRGEPMGIPTNIKTLLSGRVVEWARIEFKETWDAEASLKTICAFANDIDNWGGGYLVIGVKDNQGKPDSLPGVPSEKIDGYLKDLLNKCKRIQPDYMPITEVTEHQGKHFIIVWAPGGSIRPYSSPKNMAKDCRERICWIRKMASTIQPSDEELRDLYSLANNVPFDDRVNHFAELNDLNITLIQQYLREVGSSLYQESGQMDFAELCRSMNLISTLPEYTKPKNVGLMFFSLEPEKFFPYAQIDVVQFPDGLGGDQIIEKTFKGPLHQQLREALQYIQNIILTERVQKLPDVAEANRFFNYPYAAVEEALSNAVYHKGYDIREPIEVRVLPDRIEILSHPGADRSISMEGLKNYRVSSRRYRNRRIGEFLKELHLTEGRNTGFQKIIRAMKSNGSPMPIFETDEERTYFLTTFLIHPDFDTSNDGINVGINVELNDAVIQHLTDKEQTVMHLIRRNPSITVSEISVFMGVSAKTAERAIKSLKEKEIIVREGAKRNGKWIILK